MWTWNRNLSLQRSWSRTTNCKQAWITFNFFAMYKSGHVYACVTISPSQSDCILGFVLSFSIQTYFPTALIHEREWKPEDAILIWVHSSKIRYASVSEETRVWSWNKKVNYLSKLFFWSYHFLVQKGIAYFYVFFFDAQLLFRTLWQLCKQLKLHLSK